VGSVRDALAHRDRSRPGTASDLIRPQGSKGKLGCREALEDYVVSPNQCRRRLSQPSCRRTLAPSRRAKPLSPLWTRVEPTSSAEPPVVGVPLCSGLLNRCLSSCSRASSSTSKRADEPRFADHGDQWFVCLSSSWNSLTYAAKFVVSLMSIDATTGSAPSFRQLTRKDREFDGHRFRSVRWLSERVVSLIRTRRSSLRGG
jgi:hypothetical protein